MTDWINDHIWLAWLIIATAFGVAEMFSLDLVLLMFAIGALTATAGAALGLAPWVTVVIFALVSLALLVLVRPAVVKRLHAGPTLSVGHHNLVGQTAIVDETVTDVSGRVLIDGQYWTARTVAGQQYDPGTEVVVTAIEGATAVVAAKES